ncbi:MAG: hypothetical protein ACE5ES_00105 [Candidatus Nanoarchaeia archaeon]
MKNTFVYKNEFTAYKEKWLKDVVDLLEFCNARIRNLDRVRIEIMIEIDNDDV